MTSRYGRRWLVVRGVEGNGTRSEVRKYCGRRHQNRWKATRKYVGETASGNIRRNVGEGTKLLCKRKRKTDGGDWLVADNTIIEYNGGCKIFFVGDACGDGRWGRRMEDR